jgi:hypothetical protein
MLAQLALIASAEFLWSTGVLPPVLVLQEGPLWPDVQNAGGRANRDPRGLTITTSPKVGPEAEYILAPVGRSGCLRGVAGLAQSQEVRCTFRTSGSKPQVSASPGVH